MSGATALSLSGADWLNFFGHLLFWSLLSVGGVMSTVPDMHRYLVTREQWLSEAQFSSSIAIAQAAPGPNILYVALFGWNVGLNTGSLSLAFFGAGIAMIGLLLPCSLLVFFTSRWSHANRERRSVQAFRQGLAPVVIALMLSTGWLLARAYGEPVRDWPLWLLIGVSALLVWRTRLHILWLLLAGAVLGAFGLL